ncbi:MAG TPA: response regulator [Bryobacteraceae bacterium]|jgi:DNA-binding response OmpR family regulator
MKEGNGRRPDAQPRGPIEILLIEDHDAEALLIKEILEELPLPLHVRIARDGMEALLMIANGARLPGLIIVDLNLPYISGHGVIEQFHPKDVPVIAFTSSQKESDRKLALELGARDYVQKPMDLASYTEAVRGIVRRWAPRAPGQDAPSQARQAS